MYDPFILFAITDSAFVCAGMLCVVYRETLEYSRIFRWNLYAIDLRNAIMNLPAGTSILI